MKRITYIPSEDETAIMSIGPYRIIQVDDSIIEERPTQEKHTIIPIVSSTTLTYGKTVSIGQRIKIKGKLSPK